MTASNQPRGPIRPKNPGFFRRPADTIPPMKERDRRVVFTMFAAAGARAISLLTLLVSVPLTVNYLGTERYGLWVTISSLLALLSFADLGIGNGLLNAITQCHGRDDREAARQYVASGLLILTGVALLLALILGIAYPWISWKAIFNVSDPKAVAEAGPATAVFLACFLANIPLSVVQKVQQGYQEGFIDSAWLAAGKLLALIGLLLVISFKGGLPWLVLALAGSPVLVACANGIALFAFRKPFLRPRLSDATWAYGRRVLDIGFLFFIVQTAAAVAYSADNFIVAHFIGPQAVAEYSVVYQMSSLGPVLLSMFLIPLWPAYGEAIVRGDSQWVRTTFRRSIAIGLSVNVPYALLLMFYGNVAIHLWVGNKITASFMVLVAFAIWTMMNSFSGAMAALLNGANAMRFQAVCAVLMACLNLLLSIILTKSIGLSGVIWGSIIAQVLLVFVPSTVYISRFMQRLMFAPSDHSQREARTLV